MISPCENHFLEELRAGTPSAYELLYKAYFPSIAYLVTRNRGNDWDAEDLFQETVIVLLEKIRQPHFQLTSSLKTYLYAIARNNWLKRLRDEKLVVTDDEAYLAALQDEVARLETDASTDGVQPEQVHDWLSQITSNCQRVLTSVYFTQEPLDSLMLAMGWKNRHTANNQKYKCIQQIKRVAIHQKGAI
jgi:RNA polymerase sigma factor (sigma-70 family)